MLLPRADADVALVEPNFIIKAAQVPPVTNDPYLGELWGMLANTSGGADAAGAWTQGYTDCSGVVIAVIGEWHA